MPYGDTKTSKDRLPKGKIHKVLHEFKERVLHSGSKKGPVVNNRKQAIAIALSEARKQPKLRISHVRTFHGGSGKVEEKDL